MISESRPTESQRVLSPESFAGFRISRCEIRLRAAQEAIIPAFPGSTLRGTFGHALKQAVCVMNHRDCGRCLVADKCIYPYVFETAPPPDLAILRHQRDAPHPFVLDSPVYGQPLSSEVSPEASLREPHRVLAVGDEIVFGLTLMGRAIEYAPYLVYAIHEMAQRGLGKGRAQFVLADVSTLETSGRRQVIYTETSQRLDGWRGEGIDLSEWIIARLAPPEPDRDLDRRPQIGEAGSLKLRFVTPTRIKTRDDLQPQADFVLLIRSLMRRISMLLAVHGERSLELDFKWLLEQAAAVNTGISSLRWWDWSRYSNRQQTKLQLGGFVGEIVYQGRALTEFLPLLAAGEILRVGNGTSFGLGKYVIEHGLNGS